MAASLPPPHAAHAASPHCSSSSLPASDAPALGSHHACCLPPRRPATLTRFFVCSFNVCVDDPPRRWQKVTKKVDASILKTKLDQMVHQISYFGLPPGCLLCLPHVMVPHVMVGVVAPPRRSGRAWLDGGWILAGLMSWSALRSGVLFFAAACQDHWL